MTSDASDLFLLFSAVIALGFLGYLVFERARISEVLFLILFGILIGPVLHLVPADTFTTAAPFIASLALAMVMFGGGLEFHFDDVARGAGRAGLLAGVGLVTTTSAITLVGVLIIHLGWLESLLLALVFGHVSTVIVFPLLNKLGVASSTRVMLGLDSAIAEVVSVVGVIAISEAIALHNTQVSHAVQAIASQFAVAIVLGLIGGVAWSRLLTPLASKRYNYMLTLSVILALHVGVTALGGNGPIGVLVFELVLGNAALLRRTGLRAADFNDEMRNFQGEVTFFLRTFFFVYLGLTVTLGELLDPAFLRISLAITIAIFVARVIAMRLSTVGTKLAVRDLFIVGVMIPRGLATAVLAALPFAAYGIDVAREFPAYALGVIILTNVVTTVGVFVGTQWPSRRVNVQTPKEKLPLPPRP